MNSNRIKMIGCLLAGISLGLILERGTLKSSETSAYYAVFRTVDDVDDKPIESSVTLGPVMHEDFGSYTEGESGEWRVFWKDTPNSSRKLEILAEGYKSIFLPASEITEIKSSSYAAQGGLTVPYLVRMRRED